MARPFSSDLRERVVTQVDAGHSRREVARRFGVSASFVVKPVARRKRTGSVAAAQRGRPFGFGKLAGVRDALIARVEAAPDTTLAELTDWLGRAHDVRVHLYSVCRVLRAAGFTYKKIAAGGGGWTREGAARAPGLASAPAAVDAPRSAPAGLH